MKAIVFDPEKVKPIMSEMEIPVPGESEVVIQMKAAALNHRDLNITNPANKQSFIYGSDGAGIIVSTGENVTRWKAGDEVIINAMISCLTCSYCLKGEHSLCENASVLGGRQWNGTFAEYVKVPAANVERKPEHLSFYEAAALPLALGTAWRSLITKAQLKPGEKVLIQGIGGGVALYCLQIARAIGAQVYVTSGLQEKIDRAIELGATAGINYHVEDVIQRGQELTEGAGFDVIVSSNGATIPTAVTLAKNGGRIVQYAYIGKALPEFDVDQVMFKQLTLLGAAMGTYSEFTESIKFVDVNRINPVVSSILPLEQFQDGFDQIAEATQFGKVVFSI